MMRFYALFITEATSQVTMALRSERAMVGRVSHINQQISFLFDGAVLNILREPFHYPLTCDADVDKRIASLTSTFLKN